MGDRFELPLDRRPKSKLATQPLSAAGRTVTDISPDARVAKQLLRAIGSNNQKEINLLFKLYGAVYLNRLIRNGPMEGEIADLLNKDETGNFKATLEKFYELLNDKLADAGPSA